jgi:hypothetical protein
MLVRVKYGHRAGQIQDIEFTAAKLMLADGRASLVQYDQGTEAEAVDKPAAAADPASEPQKQSQLDSTKTVKASKKK